MGVSECVGIIWLHFPLTSVQNTFIIHQHTHTHRLGSVFLFEAKLWNSKLYAYKDVFFISSEVRGRT